MNERDRSTAIRENGQKLLASKRILQILQPYGEVHFTGSFALDLMAWNDIDMQIHLKPKLDPIQVAFSFFQEFINDPELIETRTIKMQGTYKSRWPRGFYFGSKFNSPEFGGIWKLDIWVLEQKYFDENQEFMNKVRAKLTPETRELILKCKFHLVDQMGRVPALGSYWIYQAVFMEELREMQEIFQYIKQHGVELP